MRNDNGFIMISLFKLLLEEEKIANTVVIPYTIFKGLFNDFLARFRLVLELQVFLQFLFDT